ncbi:site-specific DNA-methyltransferase [Sphingomonas sp. SRS2]|uniref:site-specific DNA-methyltransferase n=1 Tax=Sphingomonas sp. SRS2 TaxID=133190 RepID=UPI000618486E|nr:site-specific DNA-methyltransferase [Sphingomonas sp. SRS2]KKC23980.1 DNA methylase N-4 [Sphingomonas sp. SRS2]
MTNEDHKIEYVGVGRLKASANNARNHPKRQIAQIAKSIRAYGFTLPLLIDESDTILAGHGRLLAAKSIGLKSVPCVRITSLSEAQKRAYLIADNKLAMGSTWDYEILASELQFTIDAGLDLELTGFEQVEADIVIDGAKERSVNGPDVDNADDIPEMAGEAISRLGDRWLLGRHVLLCGDAKDSATMDALMDGERAHMAFTDPPYNVKIDGNVGGLGKIRHREFAEASGEMSSQQFQQFLVAAFENIERVCANGAIVFTCMDWRHLGECLAAGLAVFTEYKNVCIWVKTNGGMGTFYRSQHEEVLVWKVGDAPHTNNFELGDKGRHRTNVWTYAGINSFKADRMEELILHPTVKPVPLVADAIKDVSKRGQIVLDPFGGSGTTLIAAEKTGRVARVMEIDPLYCDVIVRRWERFTGKTAILAETSQSFEDVVLERQAINAGADA